jgi:ATP-dependent DNA helicase RecQ
VLPDAVARAPASLAELGSVNGVGENKLARYGEQVLATLAEAQSR